VLEMRESKSRPANGIVVFLHKALNQRNEVVAQCKRSALMLKTLSSAGHGGGSGVEGASRSGEPS